VSGVIPTWWAKLLKIERVESWTVLASFGPVFSDMISNLFSSMHKCLYFAYSCMFPPMWSDLPSGQWNMYGRHTDVFFFYFGTSLWGLPQKDWEHQIPHTTKRREHWRNIRARALNPREKEVNCLCKLFLTIVMLTGLPRFKMFFLLIWSEKRYQPFVLFGCHWLFW
jgi:hypothetical protein